MRGDSAEPSPTGVDGRELGVTKELKRRRSALLITETELRLIAAAAIIGLSSSPVTG